MGIIANIIGYMVLVAIAIIVFAVCVATVRIALGVILVVVDYFKGGEKNEQQTTGDEAEKTSSRENEDDRLFQDDQE